MRVCVSVCVYVSYVCMYMGVGVHHKGSNQQSLIRLVIAQKVDLIALRLL